MVDKLKSTKAYGHFETSLDLIWIIASALGGAKLATMPGENIFVMYNAPIWQLVATVLFATAIYRVYNAMHKAGN